MRNEKETIVVLKNIVDTMEIDKDFKAFAKLIRTAGLEAMLTGDKPVTVFAPTEKAFGKLTREKRQALSGTARALAKILIHHMVPGQLIIRDIMALDSAVTVEGDKLLLTSCDGLKVNNAYIVKADVECSNGIIHGIDTVLFPKG